MSQFDKVINRRHTDSVKYDGLAKLYGRADLLPMWVADMDFQAPAAVVDAVVERAKHGIYGYALDGEYYKELPVRWHEKRHQIVYDKEAIFFTPSVLSSLNLAILAFTEKNDSIMLSLPTYGPFVNLPLSTDRRWVGSHFKQHDGRFEIDFDDFEKQIITHDVKMYILCHPHNPTGRVWQQYELERIIAICKKHQVFIVADEIHSDLIMPGQSFVPTLAVARQLDYAEQVMVMCSPTKTFNLAGLQVSYYILESKVRQEQLTQVTNYTHTSGQLNNFAYISLGAAYAEGDDYVSELTEYIYGNYQYLKGELSKHCPQVQVSDLEATYLLWLSVGYLDTTEAALKEATISQGLAIQTSQDFFEAEDLCLRINLACPRSVLVEGTDLLIKSLKSLE